MRLAFQGEFNSNSEFAAKQLAQLRRVENAVFIPCRTSKGVVSALESGKADYGVVARSNSTLGSVAETTAALNGLAYEKIGECSLPIHHQLFVLTDRLSPTDVSHVHSHPQALGQCRKTLRALLPNASPVETEDTSFAAQQLALGHLSDTSAVVCRREAGEAYGLHLLKQNVEDVSGNATNFWLISMRPSSVRPRVGLRDRISHAVCRPLGIKLIIIALVALLIFGTAALNAIFGWSSVTVFSNFASLFAASFIAVTSPKFVLWAQHRRVLGYWRYHPIPSREDAPAEEVHGVVRVVVIDRENGDIRLRGWQAGDGESHRWESTKTLFRPSEKASGQLVYGYSNTLAHKQSTLAGIVSLEWNTSDAAQRVTSMYGLYYGHGATQDDGQLTYERISESEFERLRFAPSAS